MEAGWIYWIVISFISIVTAVYDKWASRHRPRQRTPERILFLLCAAGGSLAMYMTMKLIRHKTRHRRFMLGIPAIFLLQLAVLAAWLGTKSL